MRENMASLRSSAYWKAFQIPGSDSATSRLTVARVPTSLRMLSSILALALVVTITRVTTASTSAAATGRAAWGRWTDRDSIAGHEMHELRVFLVSSGTKSSNLVEDHLFTSILVSNNIKSIDNNENVGLLSCGSPNEFFGRLREVIGSRDHKHHHIDFLLPGKDSGCLGCIRIETRGVDQGNVHHTIVQERFVNAAAILDVDFALSREHIIGRLIISVVRNVLMDSMHLFNTGVLPSIEDLAKDSSAGLLILSILDSFAQSKKMFDAGANLSIK
ncbi:hypothetical protein HG530_000659 [Fusarium avenaceum]|nr:hypothetical protein HG530_000659 [Fusarium avenaceum]